MSVDEGAILIAARAAYARFKRSLSYRPDDGWERASSKTRQEFTEEMADALAALERAGFEIRSAHPVVTQ
ncbi:MAG TPA: hypothetical protein VFX37_09800 [Pseudolabrys sp.]|nr:hypothetical protein [Pseudolabrys sp.]